MSVLPPALQPQARMLSLLARQAGHRSQSQDLADRYETRGNDGDDESRGEEDGRGRGQRSKRRLARKDTSACDVTVNQIRQVSCLIQKSYQSAVIVRALGPFIITNVVKQGQATLRPG